MGFETGVNFSKGQKSNQVLDNVSQESVFGNDFQDVALAIFAENMGQSIDTSLAVQDTVDVPVAAVDQDICAKYKELVGEYNGLSSDEEKLNGAFNIALAANAAGDITNYKKWKNVALENAKLLPASDKIALPLVSADFDAIEGNYKGSVAKYESVINLLNSLDDGEKDASVEMKDLQDRLKQVLYAQAFSVFQTSAGTSELNINFQELMSLKEKRDEVVGALKKIYAIEPTEANLTAIFAAYTSLSLDVAMVNEKVEANQAAIDSYHNKLVAQMLGNIGDPSMGPKVMAAPKDEVQALIKSVTDFSKTMDIMVPLLEIENQYLAGEIAEVENQLINLISEVHEVDEQEKYLHLAEMYAYFGDMGKMVDCLDFSHTAFKEKSENGVIPSKVEMIKDITTLHRLYSLKPYGSAGNKALLDEAKEEIAKLMGEKYFPIIKTIVLNKFLLKDASKVAASVGLLKEMADDKQASLLYFENMVLEADYHDDAVEKKYEAGEISEEEYFVQSKKGYEVVASFAASYISALEDGEMKAIIAGKLAETKLTLFERTLSEANIVRIQESNGDAKIMKASAVADITATFAAYKDILGENYAELKSQADFALAYYEFRNGEFENCIKNLQNIAKLYPESSSAKAIFAEGSWPRNYGITTLDGKFSPDLHDESTWAAFKTIVGKLDDQQGRGLIACGIGAGLYVLADIAIGEKISGAGVLLACTGAYAIDRATIIIEDVDEVSEAYYTGVSNITAKEAAINSAMFLVDLASIYAGGAAGRVTQGLFLKAGNFAKGKVMNAVLKRAALKGPWKRSSAGFLLKESSYLVNAAVFNEVSSMIKGSVSEAVYGPSTGKKNTGKDVWTAWLFVRLLPFFFTNGAKLNFGEKIIKGAGKLDTAAKFGINTAAASTALQGVMALTMDNHEFSANNVASTFKDLLLLELGIKSAQMVLSSGKLAKLGYKYEEVNYGEGVVKKISGDHKKTTDSKYGLAEGKVWFWKKATSEVIHTYDYCKVVLQSLYTGIAGKPAKALLGLFEGGKNKAFKAENLKTEANNSSEQKTDLNAQSAFNAKKSGFFGKRWQVVKDTWVDLTTKNWNKFQPKVNEAGKEYFDIESQTALKEAAIENTKPWEKTSNGKYSEAKMEKAAEDLYNQSIASIKDAKLVKENPKTAPEKTIKAPDTTIFKGQENSAPGKKPSLLSKTVSAVSKVLVFPFTAFGKYVKDVASEVVGKNPRYEATRNIIVATKELQRRVVVNDKNAANETDLPSGPDLLWKLITGKKSQEKAQQNEIIYNNAYRNDNPSLLDNINGAVSKFYYKQKYNYNNKIGNISTVAKAASVFYKHFFEPLWEATHVASIFYAGADIAMNVNFAANWDDDESNLFKGISFSGAIAFVLGSNYLVGKKAGITTLGGGFYAELFKSLTWGMLVWMNGSEFWNLDKKPEDIISLHLEYFAVLMGQVIMTQGMHSKAGNSIYNFLTNTPFIRNIPSLSAFYAYYTPKSTMAKPDFRKDGRWIFTSYIAPFQMANAWLMKKQSLLNAHPNLGAHRALKVAHLGIWLKPLGAKLGQAGTAGQLVERVTGLFADYVDGLITPIKLGKPTYKNNLKNNITSEISDEDAEKAAEQLYEVADINHEIFKKTTQSFDIIGLVGNEVAKKAGYEIEDGDTKWHFGTRNEVEGISTYLKVMEGLIDKMPENAPVGDAMAFNYTLDAYDKLGISFDNDSDLYAVLVKSAMVKMWANKGNKNSKYGAYKMIIDQSGGNKKTYWDNIPEVKDEKELNWFATKLHFGDIDGKKLIEPLKK